MDNKHLDESEGGFNKDQHNKNSLPDDNITDLRKVPECKHPNLQRSANYAGVYWKCGECGYVEFGAYMDQ